MQIKVPKTIQVGGHVYTLSFSEAPRDDGNAAQVNHRLQTIQMLRDRKSTKRQASLIHELLHIIDVVYLNSKLGEDEINGLAQGLNQIFPQLGIELDWSELDHQC